MEEGGELGRWSRRGVGEMSTGDLSDNTKKVKALVWTGKTCRLAPRVELVFARRRAENVSFKRTFCCCTSSDYAKKIKGISCHRFFILHPFPLSSILFHSLKCVYFFLNIFFWWHMFPFHSSHWFCHFLLPSLSLRCLSAFTCSPTAVVYSSLNSSPLTRCKTC